MPDKRKEELQSWLLLLQDVWPIGVAFVIFVLMALPFFINWFR
jgi:hypothetical protein